mgnify:CR=1 FL=1
MIYTLVKNLFKILFTIFLRLKVEGTENIPKDGPLVIASNHLSLLDPPVLGTAATRKVHFMAKEELFVPVLGTIYKILGAFPVRRGGADRAAIKHGIDILESGQVLAIFPEGTRSKTGELGKAQPGALMMASKAKATIVPACIMVPITSVMAVSGLRLRCALANRCLFLRRCGQQRILHAMTEELMHTLQAAGR